MATTNFTFTTFTGSETAGWNSINTIINSIDAQLYAKASGIASGGSSGQVLTWSGTSWVAGTVGASGIDNNAVALGTKTTGDYVASVAAAGSGEVVVTGSGESAAATVRLADNTALRGAATVATPPTYSNGATGTVGRIADARYVTDALAYATAGNITLTGDVTLSSGVATIQPTVVTEGKIASNAVTQDKMANDSVGTAEIINSNVTYAKLASNAKAYSMASTATAGTFFTGSGNFTTASLSTASAQNPFVISYSGSPLTLTIPYGLTTVPGTTITVCQLGTGSTTISTSNGTNGSKLNDTTNGTAIIGAQYSVITLIFLYDVGDGLDRWLIMGDYI
jgi:hypothetical protein